MNTCEEPARRKTHTIGADSSSSGSMTCLKRIYDVPRWENDDPYFWFGQLDKPLCNLFDLVISSIIELQILTLEMICRAEIPEEIGTKDSESTQVGPMQTRSTSYVL